MVHLKQVHSNWVKSVLDSAAGSAGEGDALITDRPGALLSVRTADCLPILIADPTHHAVAAVHAGWRGTAAEIGPATLVAMSGQFGTRAEDVLVAIGPGIGPCCFEVGPEVGSEFERFFPERNDLRVRTRIDLAEANRRQFASAGVPAAQIELLRLCTRCLVEEFHSYRRDGKGSGRMVSAIGICTA